MAPVFSTTTLYAPQPCSSRRNQPSLPLTPSVSLSCRNLTLTKLPVPYSIARSLKSPARFLTTTSASNPAKELFPLLQAPDGYREKKRENGDLFPSSKSGQSWIDEHLPRQVQPYARLARLDKPIGTWLLAWPCMWSLSLAALPGNVPDFKMICLLGIWALLSRGAGCTVNDILDVDFDRKVKRTKTRPIASGNLTPFQGVCFLAVQLLLGLGILLPLNNYSRILGASYPLLYCTYPLMKRITYWPQAYLGLAFNWGALMGWSAVKGSLDPAIVLPLYASGVFWTLVYDTIYAHQDKEDDLKVGVKSTALRFGDSTKKWISGFGMACIGNLALSGFNANLGWPFYAFLAVASGQLAWQIWTVDLSSSTDCSRKFVSNNWFGAIIFSGILFGRVWS
ncbi:Palmitoyl-protein thioesterase 1 [Turnera subulata]|uniref:4-hydroxybenzoate polyprenyltransferase, mitochondrial n=1 Tax=Turnera subulata TaxID=218843 RepID=A0A9Q0F272_9ROSI|nr:Palmitoyl-protein thioesterase 1 [Turnera subulata]